MLHGGLFHSNEVTIEDLLQINRCMFSLQDIPKGVIMVMMIMIVMMMVIMMMVMMMNDDDNDDDDDDDDFRI